MRLTARFVPNLSLIACQDGAEGSHFELSHRPSFEARDSCGTASWRIASNRE